jgi:uroporphyrinogen decarboxylase
MTSREMVLAAVLHKKADKVPVDLGATPSSGISAIAYSNLLKHLAQPERHVKIYDVVQQLAQPDWSLIEKFGVDVIDIGRTFNVLPSDWYKISMANGALAYYPKWFYPTTQDDGSFLTFDDDGKRALSTMPVGATFYDGSGLSKERIWKRLHFLGRWY